MIRQASNSHTEVGMNRKPVVKDQTQFPILMKLSSLKEKIPADKLEFARSLVTNFNKYGSLSAKQMYHVNKMISDIENPAAEPEKIQISVIAINKMFELASQKLKRVKVTLQASNGQKVVFKKAGNYSKYVGQILISDGGPYGNAVFFGRITQEGLFIGSSKNIPEVTALVQAFAADPEGVAAAYGKLTGSCCFCTKPLSDDRSLHVGYGPTCAKNHGLRWGK